MSLTKEEPTAFRYGTNGDEFKPLAEVLLSDVRQTHWIKLHSDGTARGIQLEDLHKQMSELNLNANIQEDVRTGFETARNLYLYSWFVYRFQTVAELQAYATLELALGKRIEAEGLREIKNLGPRLKFAREKEWLIADGIRIYRERAEQRKRHVAEQDEFFKEFLQHEQNARGSISKTEEEHAADYLLNITDGIPRLRNSVAHGNPMLHGGSAVTLEICCDLINQLFPQEVASAGESRSNTKENGAADGDGGA